MVVHEHPGQTRWCGKGSKIFTSLGIPALCGQMAVVQIMVPKGFLSSPVAWNLNIVPRLKIAVIGDKTNQDESPIVIHSGPRTPRTNTVVREGAKIFTSLGFQLVCVRPDGGVVSNNGSEGVPLFDGCLGLKYSSTPQERKYVFGNYMVPRQLFFAPLFRGRESTDNPLHGAASRWLPFTADRKGKTHVQPTSGYAEAIHMHFMSTSTTTTLRSNCGLMPTLPCFRLEGCGLCARKDAIIVAGSNSTSGPRTHQSLENVPGYGHKDKTPPVSQSTNSWNTAHKDENEAPREIAKNGSARPLPSLPNHH